MRNPETEVKLQENDEQEVFVGPRPFERSEENLFFGRDREISELLSLATSNRVVLCYAPSGAGKTSLINAGLQPRLEKEGFEVLPPTRVRGLIPEGVDQSTVTNIYVFNTLLSLAKDTVTPGELARYTVSEYLSSLPHLTDEDDFPSPRILIFDQFEELVTSYLDHWQEREGFFQQVGDALQADPLLRVLFVMREDFQARIEPFMRSLKPLSQARFRLDLLGRSGAQAAVTGPLHGTQRHFKDGVVNALIEELQKVRVETTQGEATEVVGEYVEPVQLQVVCRNLWTSLPPDVQEISHEHLKAYGDVDQALRDFYESCITGVKTSLRLNEANLRQWFELQLITPAGTRSIVFRDAQQTAGMSNAVVDFLENRHVIRGEWRAGSRWYELTHDRLIEPIQRANERWRAQRQSRRNRILGLAGGSVILVTMVLAAIMSFPSFTISALPTNSTFVAAVTSGYENATLVVEAQSTSVAVQSTSVAVQADASLSKSRQLAAEALLANGRNLSLLLAVQSNRLADTVEARRSLHRVLSQQSYFDGMFLREFRSGLITPTLIKRLDNHQSAVVSVAFSPDGQRFISGSVNGSVLLWDVATAKPIDPSLSTRGSGIESVAYSPDGSLVASAGQDERISIWNAATGEIERNIAHGHEGLVTCITFSPDGTLLASGGLDRHVFIWDTSSGRLVEELKDENRIASLAWSPDGKTLAVGTFGSTVSFWKNEGQWMPDDGLYGLSHPVRSMAWSPDGKLLVLGLGSNANDPAGGDVILWDYDSRTKISTLPDDTTRVQTVAFHPSGKFLAVGWDDATIVFLDVQGQILGRPFIAHGRSAVTSIAFNPDGRYLLSGGLDRTVALWNLSAPTSVLAPGPTGNLLASGQGSIIRLWDLSTDEIKSVKVLSEHTDNILSLAFSPDGQTLASSGLDNVLRFWSVNTGQQLRESKVLSNVRTMQFSPDGAMLAVAGDSGRAQLSIPATGLTLYSLIEHEGPPVLKVQFSEAGKTLDIVKSNGSLTTFDLQHEEPSILQESVLPSTQDGITSIALSPDGKRAAYFRFGGSGQTATLSNDGRAHGIELSSFNQSFDPTVNPNDIDFILVKATEGTQYVDPNFEKYLKQIQSIPLRGAYHYFQGNQPWQAQADLFLSTVKDKGFHFYVLYLESPPKVENAQFLGDAENWLKYVDDRVIGKVLIGTSSSFLSEFGSSANWMKDWPLLVAQYPLEPNRDGNPTLPPGFTDWKIWNYTDKGDNTEFGTGSGGVYLEVFNGTPQDMGEWLGLNAFSLLDRSTGTVIHPGVAVEINSIHSFAFSPDNTYLAAAGDGGVFLLNAETGEEISTLNIGGRTVYSLDFMPDSDRLVIGTDDGTVLLWDLSILRSAAKIESVINIACSQVSQNFSTDQWTQFIGADVPYVPTCPDAPVP